MLAHPKTERSFFSVIPRTFVSWRCSEYFNYVEFCSHFGGKLSLGLLVSTTAPRYSSLEADEFDEGSAAEEADASVTQ